MARRKQPKYPEKALAKIADKKPEMKEYLIELPVVAARGCQIFTVHATSEEDALARQGDWKFVEDEIEVVEVGEPRVIDEN